MAAGVAMPEIKTGGPSVGLVEKKEVSFETNIRPEDKVRGGGGACCRTAIVMVELLLLVA